MNEEEHAGNRCSSFFVSNKRNILFVYIAMKVIIKSKRKAKTL